VRQLPQGARVFFARHVYYTGLGEGQNPVIPGGPVSKFEFDTSTPWSTMVTYLLFVLFIPPLLRKVAC